MEFDSSRNCENERGREREGKEEWWRRFRWHSLFDNRILHGHTLHELHAKREFARNPAWKHNNTRLLRGVSHSNFDLNLLQNYEKESLWERSCRRPDVWQLYTYYTIWLSMFQFFDVDLLQCVRFGVSSRIILHAKHNLQESCATREWVCQSLNHLTKKILKWFQMCWLSYVFFPLLVLFILSCLFRIVFLCSEIYIYLSYCMILFLQQSWFALDIAAKRWWNK